MMILRRPSPLFTSLFVLSLLLFPYVTFCVSAASPAFAEAPNKSVLLLHSYHNGYGWTDRITGEVRNVLGASDEHIALFVEYMDTKRTMTERDFPLLAQLLEARFGQVHPDVILCCDDLALQFTLQYYDELFPGVPVVFLGVSSPRTLFTKQLSFMTGVIEDYDMEQTVNFALRLFPRTRRLAVISDSTHLGILAWEKLRPLASRLAWQAEIIPLVNLSYPDLMKRVAELPSDSVILFLSYFGGPEGSHFNSLNEVVADLHRASKVPIFTPWAFLVNSGSALGGHVVDPEEHARIAAERVLKILGGAAPADMPILWESPKITMAQYDDLKAFRIPRDALPGGTVIVNGPRSFFWEHRDLIVLGILSFFFLSLAVLLLGINIYRRRNAERKLRGQVRFLDVLIDTIPYPFFFRDRNGRYSLVNQAFARLAGHPIEEIRGKSREEIFGNDPRGMILQNDRNGPDAAGEGLNVNVTVQEPSGRRHYSLVSRDIGLPDGVAGQVGMVIDITDFKKLEGELRAREERLKLALEGGATGAWDWDIPADEVVLTGSWISRLGRRREDHLTTLKGWLGLIHPEEAPMVERRLMEHCEGKQATFSVEHRIEVRKGEWSWVLDRGRVMARDGDGRPLRFSGVLTDITEQKEVEQRRRELEGELRKAATMDRLTGTLNRQYFENLFALQIQRSETDGSPLSLIMFDIDDFKRVNDTYGHLAGDKVLVSICDTVRAHIRQQDYFGRWGGEEFNILILGGAESAFQVAEKIRVMIDEGDHGIPGKVTVSLGLATFCKGDHVEDLVRRADENLYLAKRNGKNRVEGAKILPPMKEEEDKGT